MRNMNIAYRILGNHLSEEGLITDLKDLSLLKDRMVRYSGVVTVKFLNFRTQEISL